MHDVSARLSHAIQAIADRMSDDARIGVDSVVAHRAIRGSEAPPLTLGPAKLTLLRHQDVLDAIRTGKQLTPDIETKLKTILDEFAKSFA